MWHQLQNKLETITFSLTDMRVCLERKTSYWSAWWTHYVTIFIAEKYIKKKITKQREIIALDRQETHQQRPESPTVTPPCMRVNTRYINSKVSQILLCWEEANKVINLNWSGNSTFPILLDKGDLLFLMEECVTAWVAGFYKTISSVAECSRKAVRMAR